MATRIEFHQHGGPDVLQALEFTPKDPAEHEIQVENKAIGINYIDTYSTVHNVPADKAAILPDAISFEQAAASFLKGLTVYYLLRKTYEIKAGEPFLFHAAAGGVGLIACQWAKALGAKLIGTVGSVQKAPNRPAPGRSLTIAKRISSSA